MKVDCCVARWWGWAARPEFRHRATSNFSRAPSRAPQWRHAKEENPQQFFQFIFSRHTLALSTLQYHREQRTRLALNRLLLPYAQTPLKSPAASRPLLCRLLLCIRLIDLLDVRAAAAAAARGRTARHTARLLREREGERSVRHTSRKKCATIDCVLCSVWTQSLTMPPGMPPMPPPPPPCE